MSQNTSVKIYVLKKLTLPKKPKKTIKVKITNLNSECQRDLDDDEIEKTFLGNNMPRQVDVIINS